MSAMVALRKAFRHRDRSEFAEYCRFWRSYLARGGEGAKSGMF